MAAAAIRNSQLYPKALVTLWKRCFAQELKKQLQSIVGRLKSCHCTCIDQLNFRDSNMDQEGTAVRQYAEGVLKRNAREKIWLLQLASPAGVGQEPEMAILEYADISKEFQLANDHIRLTPVFAALANKGHDWRSLPTIFEAGNGW